MTQVQLTISEILGQPLEAEQFRSRLGWFLAGSPKRPHLRKWWRPSGYLPNRGLQPNDFSLAFLFFDEPQVCGCWYEWARPRLSDFRKPRAAKTHITEPRR